MSAAVPMIENIRLRVSRSQKAEIAKAARRRGMTISEFVREAVNGACGYFGQ